MCVSDCAYTGAKYAEASQQLNNIKTQADSALAVLGTASLSKDIGAVQVNLHSIIESAQASLRALEGGV